MLAIFFHSQRTNDILILLSSLSNGISFPTHLMWVNWHVASTSLTDGSVMTITQLLQFVTQVLGLALPASQQFTNFWQTPTVVKRSKERAHTRSAGTHPSLQWALWLSQTHGYHCFLVSESLSDSWPLSATCKETILV